MAPRDRPRWRATADRGARWQRPGGSRHHAARQPGRPTPGELSACPTRTCARCRPRVWRRLLTVRPGTNRPPCRPPLVVAIGVSRSPVVESPRTGIIRRHHAHARGLPRAVSWASRAAGLTTRLRCHPVRRRVATPLLQQGDEIRTVQKLLGHNDVKTTMMYTPVLTRGRLAVRSPLDERGCPGHVPAFLEP